MKVHSSLLRCCMAQISESTPMYIHLKLYQATSCSGRQMLPYMQVGHVVLKPPNFWLCYMCRFCSCRLRRVT